jgi:hypothetical protein
LNSTQTPLERHHNLPACFQEATSAGTPIVLKSIIGEQLFFPTTVVKVQNTSQALFGNFGTTGVGFTYYNVAYEKKW